MKRAFKRFDNWLTYIIIKHKLYRIIGWFD